MNILAGATGVDYSYARPNPDTLAAKGFTFACRYICDSSSSPKVLQPAERDRLHAAHIAIVLVWETTATRPLAGATAGTADGAIATERALALGYPLDCPIVIAVDFDAVAATIGPVEQYVRAFVAASRYPCGIYGDTDILGRCHDVSVLGWLPNATGWSLIKDDRFVHVKQGHEDLINGWDPNVAVKPFTAWTIEQPAPPPQVQTAPPSAPIPQPTLTGDDVNAIMRVNEDGAIFLGVVNAHGAALDVSWSGPGDDPRTLPRIAAHRAAGAVDLPIPKTGLLNCTTSLPIPPGYTAADFFRVNG